MIARHAQKDPTRGRIIFLIVIALIAVGIAALILTSCSSSIVQSKSDPNAAKAEITQTPPPIATWIKPFGQVYTWDDNISLSVSEPQEFTPTNSASGVIPGQKSLLFKIVLTNNSQQPFKGLVYPSVSSGGVESKAIFDVGNPSGSISMPPSTSVLPGKTLEWVMAYSVKDSSSITFELSPGINYKDAIFTNVKP